MDVIVDRRAYAPGTKIPSKGDHLLKADTVSCDDPVKVNITANYF